MSKTTRFFQLSLFFLAVCGFCYGQVNDAGLWMELEVSKKIRKGIGFDMCGELRMNENISELGTAYIEAGPEFRIAGDLDIGLNYRYIRKRRVDDSYSTRHRINADLSWKYRIDKLSFSVRERYQRQYADVKTSPEGRVPEHSLRHKAGARYKAYKKLNVFSTFELFTPIGGKGISYPDQWRWVAGFEYDRTKKSSLKLSYLINKEVNVVDPWTDYVIGIGYSVSL